MHHSSGQENQTSSNSQKNAPSRPPLGIINVIFATSEKTRSYPSRVMLVTLFSADEDSLEPKRARILTQLTLGFLDEDKAGTIQPHDDALMVTLRIREYNVRRVLVDQGSAIEIMYLDLYKGLNLRPKNLTAYESPIVSFEGKTVIPKGQIRLPIQTD